ncbi:NFX1-type zinc finger-containing protein 1-like isoform X2 [Clavelina lepadiformis]|uniref:NFX1-type zinc finger-containing protein 1-like isoform X2 n=1 Tax=Clavelina lepadiformis TaxID=159417 RepID=UPI0040426830
MNRLERGRPWRRNVGRFDDHQNENLPRPPWPDRGRGGGRGIDGGRGRDGDRGRAGPVIRGRGRGVAPNNGTNHNHRVNAENHVIQLISYKALEEMVQDETIEARNVTLRLASDHSGFCQRLSQTDLDGGMIQMLLKVIGKMCRDDDPPDSLKRVLNNIIHTKFTDKIIRFLHALPRENAFRKQHAATHILNCLDLLRAWITRMPATSETDVSMLSANVKIVIEKMALGSDYKFEARLKEIDEILSEQLTQPTPTEEDNDLSEAERMHEMAPPNNFRDISVYPEAGDINGTQESFLRTNLVNSAYKNEDHYLDVQFRLLREDFVRPLREGIRHCFTPGGEMRLDRQRQTNVRVYENVSIEFPKPGRTGMQYYVHFDTKRLQNVRWDASRKLMYGNLVCLSFDKFERHFLFAIIVDRDPKQLKMGYVRLEFVSNNGNVGAGGNVEDALRELQLENDSEDSSDDDSSDEDDENVIEEQLAAVPGNSLLTQADMRRRYYMVETEAYFESYRHVLAGLQKTENIPLQQYIVRCQQEIRPPRYLRVAQQPRYDFKCIIEADDLPHTDVEVLKTDSWHSTEELSLDQSQLDALKSALTNEISLIQGPPGTGKTHVGLIVMKLLLANRQRRNENFIRNPLQRRRRAAIEYSQVLVICYTNHALDQFLEGIIKFQRTDVIRVGGRCKSKVLEQYKLMNVRRNSSTTLGRLNRRTIWDLWRDLSAQQHAMESCTDVLEVSTHSVLRLQQFESIIPHPLYEQFEMISLQSGCTADDALLMWLGVAEPDKILCDKPYILEECVNAVTAPLEKMGYNKRKVVQAILDSNSMEQQKILDWLEKNENNPGAADAFPTKDIIHLYLEKIEIPFDPQPLLDQGFHPLEVKCALLATDFRRPNIKYIETWLENKNKAADKENDPVQADNLNDEEDAHLEADVEFLEEQRAIDQDDEEPAAPSRRENEKKKTDQLAAATYDDIKEKMSSGKWELQPAERKRRKNKIKLQIGRVDAMSKRDAGDVAELFSLDENNRWRLYRRWLQDLRDQLRGRIIAEGDKYNQLARALVDAQNEQDYTILRSAKVVGMTTTGAAKYRDIVQRLPAKVVIVEEAAEVLEAHIVTSMPRNTEHLILIGDHQQLKPSPTVYELAKKFNLDISLFERMIKNGIPRSKLQLQHRMRPQIASLLRPHIYQVLEDHESVLHYPQVMGVQKNVFFLSHECRENNVQDGQSKVNHHEASFMVTFCQYLIQQGYLPGQITILTAYVGQLHIINRLKPKKLAGVRVTAVDNFQGEENDIILLSLVRSNDEGKIGFLGIENRVCVALSRAKIGLFCIGDFTLLAEKSRLWRIILEKLQEEGSTGDGLPLQCRNHPEKIFSARIAKDFEKVPEGGCGQQCVFRLNCGHRCTRFCHPDDERHTKFKCRKSCERKCPSGHLCRLKCHETCHCVVKVLKEIPNCGHIQTMDCGKDPNTFTCYVPCQDVLPCGHQCLGVCGVPCPTKCEVLVEKQLPCDHVQKIPCYRSEKPRKVDCMNPCGVELRCGHRCRGNCFSCKQGRLHERCREKCNRQLFCGHICQEDCSTKCPPCKKKCDTKCQHSACPKECFEPCVLCTERCNKWLGRNRKCSKLCSEPCDSTPVTKPCLKRLKCKHSCVGIVGEKCPELCRVCNKDKLTEIGEMFPGGDHGSSQRFIMLKCKHIFPAEFLDRWMEMKADASEDEGIQLKQCPQCKTVIRDSNRYRHIINQQLRLINQVREKINGKTEDVAKARKKLLRHFVSERDPLDTDSCATEWKELQKSINESKTMNDLVVAEIRLRNLSKLCDVETAVNGIPIFHLKLPKNILESLKANITIVRDWLFNNRPYFSDQEMLDFDCEFGKIKQQLIFIKFIRNSLFDAKRGDEMLKSYLKRAGNLLFSSTLRFTDDHEVEVERAMKDITDYAPSLVSGLGISEEEKKMVVKAMSFQKGHWYKCRNDHIYCIGNCGGAELTATCPECQQTIGGAGHRLADGNQVAGEMDGSTRPAYDPQNLLIPPEV